MSGRLRAILANAGVVSEFFAYIWRIRRWWLIPLIVVLFLLGFLIVFSTATGVGPLIYTLF